MLGGVSVRPFYERPPPPSFQPPVQVPLPLGPEDVDTIRDTIGTSDTIRHTIDTIRDTIDTFDTFDTVRETIGTIRAVVIQTPAQAFREKTSKHWAGHGLSRRIRHRCPLNIALDCCH